MSSPALIMAWQFWTRHRLGLSISAACLLLMVLTFPPILRSFDSNVVFVISLIPAALVSTYVANLLLFTDEVGSLTSGYPRRMFTLPVATRTLVLWPMLIAVVAVVALWLVISVLIYERGGYRPPVLLPAVALAVLVAWNQTICWMPIKSQLVLVYSMMIGLMLLLGAPLWLLILDRVSSAVLTVTGLIELPALCALAILGLTHARRGDDWSFGLQDLSDRYWATMDRLTRQPTSFRTASQAQLWYEDRCHAWVLKGVTYLQLFMIYMFAMTSPSRAGNKVTFSLTLGCMVGTPFLMASSQGASLGRMYPLWSKQRGFMSFLAVRPILTGEMITAKYRMAARCVLHIWVPVLVLTSSWLLLKGYAGDMAEFFRLFSGAYPEWRGPTILGLAAVLAPIITWKQLTDNLVPGLTGRKWLVDGSVLASMSLLMCLIAAGLWCAGHPERLVRIIPPLTWLAGVWVIIKALLALLVFRLALRRGVAPRRVGPRYLCALARAGCTHIDTGPPAPAPERVAGPEGCGPGRIALRVTSRPVRPRAPGAGLEPASLIDAPPQQGLDWLPPGLYLCRWR
jgi:hypothetical protein